MSTSTFPSIGRAEAARSGFLVSPIADGLLLIGSPVIALVVTWLLVRLGANAGSVGVLGIRATPMTFGIGVLVAAHLVLTFVRTHGNEAIFRAHRWRFTIVPFVLLAALALVPALRIAAVVVAVAWDVHHSAMQTFGIARLYARRAGNDGGHGRTLDLVLNQAMYSGPLLAGAGLAIHLRAAGWKTVPALAGLDALSAVVSLHATILRVACVTLGLGVVALHALGSWTLARRGMRVSPQAVGLLASTGLTSVIAWGFDPFGAALFTMKLFHCVQYVTLVALAERRNVARVIGRTNRPTSLPIVAGVILAPALAYGAWARWQLDLVSPNGLALSLILTLTLLHFWYDGFAWHAPRTSHLTE